MSFAAKAHAVGTVVFRFGICGVGDETTSHHKARKVWVYGLRKDSTRSWLASSGLNCAMKAFSSLQVI